MGSRRWLGPVAAAAAVVVVAGSAAYVVRAGGAPTGPADSGPPAPLRIGGLAGAVERAAVAGPGWALTGSLPSGTPQPRPAYRTGRPDVADVRRLVEALHLKGSPQRAGGGWRVGGPRGGVLVVADAPGGAWHYVDNRFDTCPAPRTFVKPAPGDVVVCAVVPDGRPAPPDAVARAMAAPVLRAAGLDPGQARVSAAGPVKQVALNPTVGDRPTVGFTTVIDVGIRSIVRAGGWLGPLEKTGAYPLVTAAQAFDRLRALPEPMALCPVTVTGGCRTTPRSVSGARLGLVLQYDAGEPVLVPAWLFTVADNAVGEEFVPVVAVVEAFIRPAAPQPEPAGTATAEPAGGSVAGQGIPAYPGRVAPVTTR